MSRMLSSFKKRLSRMENKVPVRNPEDTPENRRIFRAFFRWKFDRVDELRARIKQGDQKALIELNQMDGPEDMSEEESDAYFLDLINGLLASGTLEPYLDSWD